MFSVLFTLNVTGKNKNQHVEMEPNFGLFSNSNVFSVICSIIFARIGLGLRKTKLWKED